MWFQRAILSGKLHPGQPVPSTRALARELKVSRIPLLGAYELLIGEGYFQSFPGAATCVSTSIPDAAFTPETSDVAGVAAPEVLGAANRTASRRAMSMSGTAREWLQKYSGCIDLEHFPIELWSKLLNRHARSASREAMGYGNPMGYGAFREALMEYLGAFRAIKCDSSQVIVTTGSQQALQIAALALLDPKDSVWIEEPGHPGTRQALQAAGARLIPVPIDGEGMRVQCGIHRFKRARAAFVTPSHQFPMGMPMSAARRIELLNWAAHNGGWIIEDDYDSEYRLSGKPIASLQGLDTTGRVIYIGSLTKVMFPALRLGYMIVPKDLIASFLDIKNANDACATSVLYQMAMTDFMGEGHFSQHVRRMRAVYLEKRDSLAAAIDNQLHGILEIVGDDSGTMLVTLLPPGTDDVEIAARSPALSVTLDPLTTCHMNRPQRGGLLIGYANLRVKEIPTLIRELRALIQANGSEH
jgi:GntR family transcriptional regulator / MocR family aminotransferase